MCALIWYFFIFWKNITKSRNEATHVGLTIPAFFIFAIKQRGEKNAARIQS